MFTRTTLYICKRFCFCSLGFQRSWTVVFLCSTFQISGSVGIFWKNPSEVGDGGDCHSYHPLDKHKGLLFGFQFIQEQSRPLQDT